MLNVNNLVGFGAGGDAGPRYWRVIQNLTTSSTSAFPAAEVEFYTTAAGSGAGLCSGGTVLSSGEDPGYPATNAFDNDTATSWYEAGSKKHYIGYAFSSGVAPVSVVLATGGTAPGVWDALNVESSEDNVTWEPVASFAGGSATAGPNPITGSSSYYIRITW